MICGLQKGLGRRLVFVNMKKDFLTNVLPRITDTKNCCINPLKDQTLLKELKIQRNVFETFNS